MGPLNINKICRLCMSENFFMVPLFTKDETQEDLSLPSRILAFATVEMFAGDGLPSQICQQCVHQVNTVYHFKTQCEKADLALRQYLSKFELQDYEDVYIKEEGDENEENMGNRKILSPTHVLYTDLNEDEADAGTGFPNMLVELPMEQKQTEDGMQGQTDEAKGERKRTRKHFSCPVCRETFVKRTLLRHHSKLHTAEPSECPLCDETFSSKSRLQRHLNQRHDGQKPYQCIFCERPFSSEASLRDHLKLHTGETLFKCPTCDKAFTRRNHLLVHLKLHSRDKAYSCPDCGKGFSRKDTMHQHRRLHSGERLNRCEICGRGFMAKSHLETHLKLHSGERPFKCSDCEKAFTQKCDLTRHYRLHTGERPFRCQVCHKAFNQKGSLRSHQFTHVVQSPKLVPPLE